MEKCFESISFSKREGTELLSITGLNFLFTTQQISTNGNLKVKLIIENKGIYPFLVYPSLGQLKFNFINVIMNMHFHAVDI